MRITFVLPLMAESGGVRAVLRHARGLRARGHEVRIVFPFWPFPFHGGLRTARGRRLWLGTLRRNLGGGWRRGFGGAVDEGVRCVPRIDARHVPDGDLVIATAWVTAPLVARLPARKGRGVYLVQHREIDLGPADQVDATYHLPLARLAGSRFTAETLARECGVDVAGLAPSGVDVAFWSAAGPPLTRRGVVMMTPAMPHKGLDDGLEALERVRRTTPGEPVRLFGTRAPARLPEGATFVSKPSDEALRDLYRNSRVLLYPSRYEGFGLPPLEAMAAGCAVVTTRVGAVPEFSRDRISAWWVEPGDIAGMAAGVSRLLADDTECERIGAAAAAAAREWDWPVVTARLEDVLQHIVDMPAPC